MPVSYEYGYVEVPVRQKPGPKPRKLEDLPIKPFRPVTRIKRKYSTAKKKEVLSFMYHHKVYDLNSQCTVREGMTRERGSLTREVSFSETAAFFLIPASTIKSWWRNRDRILKGAPRRRSKNAAAPSNPAPLPNDQANQDAAVADQDADAEDQDDDASDQDDDTMDQDADATAQDTTAETC